MVSGVASMLTVAASEQQLILVIDDVHWLDDVAVTMLHDVVCRSLGHVRWVFAGRPLGHHPHVAWPRGELERTGGVRHVELGELTLDDVRELVGLLAPEDAPETRESLAVDVMSSTGGHALFATELVGHRQRRPAASGDPPRLDVIVAGSIAGLTSEERALVEMLAVAGASCPVVVLAGALGHDPADVLELAERLEDEGLLAPVASSVIGLRHDLIARAVDGQMSRAVELTLRRRLVVELARYERFLIRYADQLLRCGDLLDDDQLEQRDRAVADAIQRLLIQVESAAARELADRYLGSTAGTGPSALEARLQAATALIATGDVTGGRATLMPLIDEARPSADRRLLADAILAAGPLTTGGREHRDLARDAEELAATLPRSEGRRRVQLACWAAHHRLNRGDRVGALYLLELAESASQTPSATMLRGLIAGVRAQSDTLVGPGPGPARRSLAELRELAECRHDFSAEVAARVLGAGHAFAEGTLADVATERDGIIQARVADAAAGPPMAAVGPRRRHRDRRRPDRRGGGHRASRPARARAEHRGGIGDGDGPAAARDAARRASRLGGGVVGGPCLRNDRPERRCGRLWVGVCRGGGRRRRRRPAGW